MEILTVYATALDTGIVVRKTDYYLDNRRKIIEKTWFKDCKP